MNEIKFRAILDSKITEFKIYPTMDHTRLYLCKLVPKEEQIVIGTETLENYEEWAILGEIKFDNLILVCNREKLSCKYGHPVEVAKRKKKIK